MRIVSATATATDPPLCNTYTMHCSWTKNTKKKWTNGKNHWKSKKLKNIKRYAKISNTTFNQRSLIHREAWFLPCVARENQHFFAAILDHLKAKNFKPETTSFHCFFKVFWISKKFADCSIGSGWKRRLNSTFEKWIYGRTDTRTHGQTNRLLVWISPEDWFSENLPIHLVCNTLPSTTTAIKGPFNWPWALNGHKNFFPYSESDVFSMYR